MRKHSFAVYMISLLVGAWLAAGCENSQETIGYDGEDDSDVSPGGSGEAGGSGSGEGGSGSGEGGSGSGEGGSGGSGSGEGGSGGSGSGEGGSGSGEGGNGGSQTSGCSIGAKRCSEVGRPQACVNHAWEDQEACANGTTCVDGTCVQGSSCESPIILEPGKTVQGSSLGGISAHTGQACGLIMSGKEAVIEVKIDKVGYYDFEMTLTNGGKWGFYASPVCDGEDMVMKDWCGGGSTNDKFTRLLNPGTLYLFVEGDGGKPAEFTASVKLADAQMGPICSSGLNDIAYGQVINITSEVQKFSGDTSKGLSQYRINSYTCENVGSVDINGGKEAVYPFRLDREAKIKARLTNIKPVDEKKTSWKAAVGIIDCVTTNTMRDRCRGVDSADSVEITTNPLKPGTYNLFVDGNEVYFTYDLEVSLVE